MEAIQLSDLPEHPYRKELAQKAATAYMTLVSPWGGDELFRPNFAFRRKVLEILDAEQGTFSSREQLRLFLWEAFTAYKMMPILHEDGMVESMKIDFPIVGDQV